MSCLTGLIISHFKGDQVGGFYIYPAGTRDCWEEYYYFVSGKEGEEPKIKVCDSEYNEKNGIFVGKVIFNGFATEMLEWIKNGMREKE
jgi:hypothetical protein